MSPVADYSHTTSSNGKGVIMGPDAILARRYVEELEELFALRQQGWQLYNEQLDGHFKRLRNGCDGASEKMQQIWFAQLQSVAKELDTAGQFVPTTSFEFLDVGCAPGGFSSYILSKNWRARGIGITLPQSAGGLAVLLERHYLSRHTMIECDLLQYSFSSAPHFHPTRHGKSESTPFPAGFLSRFPLVMLDGHTRRSSHNTQMSTKPDELAHAHAVDYGRLIVAQFIIALEAVSPGGTIVIRLSHIENTPSAHLLYMLDQLADSLIVHKPKCMLATRGTCFAIAKGVCSPDSQSEMLRLKYLKGLKLLLGELGGAPSGCGRMLAPGDFDFVATTEELLDGYLDRLVELGREVWATQVAGLRTLFENNGVGGVPRL